MTAAVVSLSYPQHRSRRPSNPRGDGLGAIVALPERTTTLEAPVPRTSSELRVVAEPAVKRKASRLAAEALWPDYWLDRSTDAREALVRAFGCHLDAVGDRHLVVDERHVRPFAANHIDRRRGGVDDTDDRDVVLVAEQAREAVGEHLVVVDDEHLDLGCITGQRTPPPPLRAADFRNGRAGCSSALRAEILRQ
jgi:hypothetical protein